MNSFYTQDIFEEDEEETNKLKFFHKTFNLSIILKKRKKGIRKRDLWTVICSQKEHFFDSRRRRRRNIYPKKFFEF